EIFVLRSRDARRVIYDTAHDELCGTQDEDTMKTYARDRAHSADDGAKRDRRGENGARRFEGAIKLDLGADRMDEVWQRTPLAPVKTRTSGLTPSALAKEEERKARAARRAEDRARGAMSRDELCAMRDTYRLTSAEVAR